MGALRQNVWILLLFVHSVLSFEYDLPSSYYNDGELISSSVVSSNQFEYKIIVMFNVKSE